MLASLLRLFHRPSLYSATPLQRTIVLHLIEANRL